MRLNELSPASGSRRVSKRRGRGSSSGIGKTGGRGDKGQKSRSGGVVRKGFEGGQMPLQRRLPKFGFRSRKSCLREEIRVEVLEILDSSTVSLKVLRENGLIGCGIRFVKLFGCAKLTRAFSVQGIEVSKGARFSIVNGGGNIEV